MKRNYIARLEKAVALLYKNVGSTIDPTVAGKADKLLPEMDLPNL